MPIRRLDIDVEVLEVDVVFEAGVEAGGEVGQPEHWSKALAMPGASVRQSEVVTADTADARRLEVR